MRYRRLLLTVLAVWLLPSCTKPVPPGFDIPFPLPLPAGQHSVGPRLSTNADGSVVLSWMEKEENGGTLWAAKLGQEGWAQAVDVVSDPKMFVNWADLPSVSVVDGDHWIAHWLSYSAELTYSYDVTTAQSFNAGTSWTEPFIPHSDGTPTEHGFVSMYPSEAGMGLLWLDGRKMVSESDDPIDSGMTLRSATLGAENALSDEQMVDDLVCDCCQTDIAVTKTGPIAVYRDRTSTEIRDIYMTRMVDGRWQPGEPVSNDGWHITGCPVNGPAIASEGDVVAIAWFTAANDKPYVRMRISTDGGKHFGEPMIVANQHLLGHVDVVVIDPTAVAISWLENDGDLKNIRVRGATVDGSFGRIHTAGRTAVTRSVPQMIRSGDKLIFAWTDENGDKVRLASVSLTIEPGVAPSRF